MTTRNSTLESIKEKYPYLSSEFGVEKIGIFGSAMHGEKVKLIKRIGDGVEVETKDKARGWATYYFIKELK